MHDSSDIPTVSIPSKSQEEIDTEKFLQTVHIPVYVPCYLI